MTEILIASAGVFFGELYGNFVGGGSLVTQAVLQGILKLPIREAMALDNSAVMGANLGMLFMLLRNNSLRWYFAPFALAQIAGAFAGVWILMYLSEQSLQIVFLLAIIGVVVKNFFFSDDTKKEKGFVVNTKNIITMTIFAFFLGTYTTAFVIGDWIISILVMTTIFKFRYHQAIFMLICTESIMKPFSTWGYYQNGLLDFNFLIPMICSTLVAGLIAGYFLEKIHSDILEKILRYLSLALVGYLFWSIGGEIFNE